jgi:hypothetical protein
MKKNTFLIAVFIVFLFSFQLVNSQNTKPISFQGKTIEMPNNIKSFDWNQLPQRTTQDVGHYVIVQFQKTPNQNIQDDFRNNGIELKDYVSNHSYFLYLPNTISTDYLHNSGVISIVTMPIEFKVSAKIRNNEIGLWAKEGNNILVNVLFHKSISTNKLISELNNISGITIKEQYKTGNLISLSIPLNKINQVTNLSTVKWIELISEPSIKEDLKGKSIHRSSNLDTQTISGRNYTGEGVGVMVRDDGIVGPHIDFQGRIDNTAANGSGQTHGDGVAGILTGAGNLDPTIRGMAAGANLFVVNYGSSFLDNATTNLLNSGAAQITNSSYGNGCNGGYSSISRTVDQQTNMNTSILHVFSAGNSGTSDCGFGAGSGWGNITGGHKQGKNVIATANVFSNGNLVSSSSRGPATDGRIKPDITAHGQGQLSTNENNSYLSFGGTSGAAPGIAGVSAQLYQLYMEANGGALPESALIKAALLNTANDYGNVGPDFKFGWGVINGLRAAMLLEDNRYLDDNISQGDEDNHTINVPANTKQVRFMVYWNDPAAIAGAGTALVNDLDLKVTSPSNTETLPWILDPSPDPTTLDLPAINGVDRLNNMEQVLINNPEAGDYTINVSGFDVPSGPQHYYIVYEVITEELTLTYPIGNEKMVVGEQEVIHWDAINTTDDFLLEYSTDNGSTWSSVATVASIATNYEWTVPDDISGESLVRITSGSFTDQSNDAFSIGNRVAGVDITKICPEDITVSWDELTDATSYDVYLLGVKFMEKVGTTTDTTFSIPITDPTGSFWVAISASGGNNWETRRSIAVNRSEGGLYNCPLSKDLAIESLTDLSVLNSICGGANSTDVSINISNLGTASQSNFIVSYQLDSNPVIQETYTPSIDPGNEVMYTFGTPLELTQHGNHTIQIEVQLAGDEQVSNNIHTEAFYFQIIPNDINDEETFETNGVPPPGWGIINADTFTGWASAEVIGSDDTLTTAAGFNNFTYFALDEEDTFVTLIYNLSSTGTVLNFDVAKAQRSTTSQDGLRIDISTDCGVTFNTVYEKNASELATTGNINSLWTPSGSSDWRNETVDLSPYQGEEIQVSFVNINGFGNNTFIDNISITGTLSTNSETFDNHFSLYPNPVENRFTIRSKKVDLKKITIFNLLGKQMNTIKIDNNQQLINVSTEDLASGIYIVRLESELGVFNKKIIKN